MSSEQAYLYNCTLYDSSLQHHPYGWYPLWACAAHECGHSWWSWTGCYFCEPCSHMTCGRNCHTILSYRNRKVRSLCVWRLLGQNRKRNKIHRRRVLQSLGMTSWDVRNILIHRKTLHKWRERQEQRPKSQKVLYLCRQYILYFSELSRWQTLPWYTSWYYKNYESWHYDENRYPEYGSLLTLGEYIPVKGSNLGPSWEGQGKKLSTFTGWAEGTNQNKKFFAIFIRSKAGRIKKINGLVFLCC